MELSSSQKGGLAELKIAAEAADLGIEVYRPMIEGARCDLIFDIGSRLLRIQCKWATRKGIRGRHTVADEPPHAVARIRLTTYSASEIDGIAAYCRELDRCFFLPIARVRRERLPSPAGPARNGQLVGVKMAADYPLGAVAQLGERRLAAERSGVRAPSAPLPRKGRREPVSGLRAALTGNACAMAGEPFDATPFLPEPGAGIDALREAAGGCRGCDLWRPATQTVFGEGPADATFVLVGEVPGDREDREGRPFVGPAGRELDRALEAAGIDRAETYVTNAVKHFRFEERGKRRIHQKPDAKQVKACRPWVLAELDALRPEVLVLLGATAAKSLLGSGSGSWPSAAGRSTATSRRSSSPRSIRRRSCAAATARRVRRSASCSARTCASRRRRSPASLAPPYRGTAVTMTLSR